MNARILLIEDEPGVALVVSDLLHAQGYIVETAGDGVTGLRMAIEKHFDMLVLDIMLPGLGGIEVCQAVREHGFDGAIVMLTAKSQVSDLVNGLRTGADDYISKPFDSDELLARITANLRRIYKENLTPVIRVKFGGVTADFERKQFSKNGTPINLAAKESELLRLLINHRGQVVPRDRILKQIWSDQPFITPRTVDVHINWLRQKLENDPKNPRHITTVRGEGYCFNLLTN